MQRKFLLSVSGAYRTTSDYKLYKILNVLPLDLEIQMFLEKQNIKKTAPNTLTKTYKDKLNELYKRRLLDEAGQIDFKINVIIEQSNFIKFLTPEIVQLLTGHGPFGDYLTKLKLIENDICTICKSEKETVEHLTLRCKEKLLEKLEINTENIVHLQTKTKQLLKQLHINHN